MSTTCKKRKPSFYVCLTCSCEAHLELDPIPGEEAGAWVLVHRFANAHATCGYVTPLVEQNLETS